MDICLEQVRIWSEVVLDTDLEGPFAKGKRIASPSIESSNHFTI